MKRNLPHLLILTCVSYFALQFFYKDQEKKTTLIRLALSNKVRSFDPAVVFNDDGLSVMAQTLDSLYQYHYLKRPYEIVPALAKSLPEISNEGKTYTIELKENIYYHPHPSLDFQRVVRAQDFVNQFKRLAFKPIESVGRWLFDDLIVDFKNFSERVQQSQKKFDEDTITGVKAIDDLTLQINLKRSEPNFLYFLAMLFVTPIPEELIAFSKNDFTSTLIGTGPYLYKGLINNKYEFEKFNRYYDERYPSVGDRYANSKKLLSSSSELLPFIDKVTFEVVESEQQRWQLFEQGEFDLISVPNKQLGEITSDENKMLQLTKKGFITKQFPKISSRWIGFNMSDPLVGRGEKAKYLRKAIAFAIDYKDYIYNMSQNTNLRATSLFNPSIPGYNPSHVSLYDFNLSRAKEYLRLSGYQNLSLIYQTRGDQELNLREARLFAKYLKRIGIKLKVEVNSFRQFLAKGRKGELTHFWTDGWIYDYPDAENILSLLYSKNAPGVNKSVFKNKSFDRLYAKLYLTPDKINRYKLFYDMEEIVHQELPWIMLMHESSYILHKDKVQNFRKSYFIRNYVKYLNL